MSNKFIPLLLIIVAVNISFSQNINLSLKESHSSSGLHYRKADLPFPLFALGIVALISPMVVFEDKKVFFGLTKEVSLGKYPYGRVSFEYSYIFRSYNTSHLRFSYNYDFFYETNMYIAFALSPGVGYFTDTKNKGWFGQLAAGAIIAMSEYITFYPNLKYRYTFINEKTKSDIHDVSLGVAFVFYL